MTQEDGFRNDTRRRFEIGLTQLNIRSDVEESGRPGGVEGREEIWVTGDFLLTRRRNIKKWFFYLARTSYSNAMCFKDNLTIKWNKSGKHRGYLWKLLFRTQILFSTKWRRILLCDLLRNVNSATAQFCEFNQNMVFCFCFK